MRAPQFRFGAVDDAPDLAALHLQTARIAYADIFPADAPTPSLKPLIEDWARHLEATSPTLVLIAEIDNEPRGVAVASSDESHEGVGQIVRLYVHVNNWRSGIGSELHNRALAHLKAHGFGRASAWVLERNHQSRSWYERRGWGLVEGRRPTWEEGGIFDVRYERDLIP